MCGFGAGNTDCLSADGIAEHMPNLSRRFSVTVLPRTASTNTLLRSLAADGAEEGTVIAACTQDEGRGRYGRAFFSPPDTGLYLSLLLRPRRLPASLAVRITTAAAVAMCEAVECLCGENADIKWVNDIFVRGKKVCGILTESSVCGNGGFLDYAVLGAGVNVFPPDGGFPKELESSAACIFDSVREGARNRLAAEYLSRFTAYYDRLGDCSFIEKYRRRSLVLGKTVTVTGSRREGHALALDIDDSCRLLVRFEDGSEEYLSCGEVSIKMT